MSIAGEILNDVKFRQCLLFKGINEDEGDKRTGTDIDWNYEDSKLWVMVEVKEYGKELPIGQRILLERFVDHMGDYKTFAFLVWHKCPPNEDIHLKDCIVSKVYYKGIHKGRWKDVIVLEDREITFKEVFSELKERYGKK